MNQPQPRVWMLAVLTALLISSCASQSSSLPNAAELDTLHLRYREIAQPQYDQLDRDRASGSLTQEEYAQEKENLDKKVYQQAVDAAWTSHALAESDRKGLGIPTPDAPQQVSSGAAGGGLMGGGFYQPRNDPFTSGGQSNYPGGGSATGSSILGNRGRNF